MQFTGILPQGSPGGVGATGLQAQPDRKGNQGEQTTGAGFLSLLQGVPSEQSAESIRAEAALPGGDAVLDAEGQSITLALSLAGALLTGNGSPQSTQIQEVPAQAPVLPVALPSTTPSSLPQETTPAQVEPDSNGALALSIDAGQLTGPVGITQQSGVSLSQVPAGLSDQETQRFVSRVEEPNVAGAILSPQEQQTDGVDEGDIPGFSPTKQQEGIATLDQEKTAYRASQGAVGSAKGTVDVARDPVTIDETLVTDPVFRLPENRPSDASKSDAVLNGDRTSPIEVQNLRAETSRPLAQFAGLESRPEFQSSDQDQQAAFTSGKDTGSHDQAAPGQFGGSAALSTHGQEFAVATNPAGRNSTLPTPSQPTAPPVPRAQLSSEAPATSPAPSVQFDLPNTDFGHLRVRVVLSDQTVHTHMVTDRADLGRLLVDRQDYLGAQLSTAGLDLGQLRVQVDRQGHFHQGYESPHRQDGRFHQAAGEQPQDRHAPASGQSRERAGVLSLFA